MTSTVPPGYTLLRPAGQGTHAKVFICLRTSAISSAYHAFYSNASSSAALTTTLLSQVVAVKVSLSTSLRREVRALNTIRTQTTLHPGAENCVQLLDHDHTTQDIKWLVMNTTPVCCDLRSFCEELPGSLPKAMLWLVTTQLYDAFWFLHRVCDPPIAHQDLGQRNFTVSLPSATTAGPPKITLVDFGAAVIVPAADNIGQLQMCEDDAANLCYEIYMMCLECRHGNKQSGGVVAKKMQRFMRVWADVTTLEQFWTEFGEFAEERVVLVQEEEWQQVKEILLEVVRGIDKRDGSLRDAVREILE